MSTEYRGDGGVGIGVIGGSGLYSLISDGVSVEVATPWGAPSDAITIGELAGRPVAFLPRHGGKHQYAPHRIPYLANLWALRSVGVRQIVTASAVGSLTSELPTGSLVAPDQILDRTHGRAHTYNSADNGVAHVGFADPYCTRGLSAATRAAVDTDLALTVGATLVVVNGPRFSTRAESKDFLRSGAHIIGMTSMPEAALARELELCLTSLCLVTDLDAGVDVGAGVTHADVIAAFDQNLPRLRELVIGTVAKLPSEQGDCACGAVYGDLRPPFDLP